jgi:hypothetical protein
MKETMKVKVEDRRGTGLLFALSEIKPDVARQQYGTRPFPSLPPGTPLES